MQYSSHLAPTSKYTPQKRPSTINPQTTISSTNNHTFSSESSHSNEFNISSSFISNDCSHLSSLHKDYKTITYSQPELLFHSIYSDQALLNIPSTTHKPFLQYPISYPSLNVNNIISNTTRNPHHSSIYLEDSNELKYYSDHDNLSPSLLPSPSLSFSTLTTPSLKHHIIESTIISKPYHKKPNSLNL